ncbi:MAG: class I SAM-dependent methyltransferase [Spirochaetota bacterium]
MRTTNEGLTPEQARRFYDRYGQRQEAHRHEDPARAELQSRGDFVSACNVFELGCGTGGFARKLFTESFPTTTRYLGVDVSETMVRLAQDNLENFDRRARVVRTDGELRFDEPKGFYDRFIATYVFDLLPEEPIYRGLVEAHRLLATHGLLCLVCLTHGANTLQRTISGLWSQVQRVSPTMLGGCRPIDITDYMHETLWEIEENRIVSAFGVPSQIVIARPR